MPGLTKVSCKELAAFNTRALYVTLGALNTNMCNAARDQQLPMDEDYKGSAAERIANFVTGDEGHL